MTFVRPPWSLNESGSDAVYSVSAVSSSGDRDAPEQGHRPAMPPIFPGPGDESEADADQAHQRDEDQRERERDQEGRD